MEQRSFIWLPEWSSASGDERPAKEAATRVMRALDGWTVEETINFYTQFQFDNDEDFFSNMLPGCSQQPDAFVQEVRAFLNQHRTAKGIILDAERRLNVLRPLGNTGS